MIGFINGIAQILKDNFIIIENNGIGYKIFATQKVLKYIQFDSKKIKIYTFMNVNENEISLFGFFDLDELNIFEKLITVSGVGAKSAISLINSSSPNEIALAIITSDIKQLSKGQGIGKKTAERIVLELKDKIETTDAICINNQSINNIQNDENKLDAIEALIALGFSKMDVVSAINKIKDDLPTEKIISLALKNLSS